MANKNPPKLSLNFAPVRIDPLMSFQVGIQPYKDRDHLQSCLNQHGTTHLFKRHGHELISISLDENHEPIGERIEEWKAYQSLGLIASLTLKALERYFLDLGRTILSHKPLRLVSNRNVDNFLDASHHQGVKLPSWLQSRVSYTFDTRILYMQRQPVVVLSCDVRVKNIINSSCDEIVSRGIPIEGRYVKRTVATDDQTLPPKRKLVGRVENVQGNTLALSDHIKGVETILLEDAYLEPRQENIKLCVSYLEPSLSIRILNKLEQLKIKLRSGSERINKIDAILGHLQSTRIELVPGLQLNLGKRLKQEKATGKFPVITTIQRPRLVFDPSGTRTDIWNERGIDEHGPYSQRFFTPTEPRIAVICQKNYQGIVEQFVHKFLEGAPNAFTGSGSYKRAPYRKGFIRRFHLDNAHVKVFVAEDAQVNSYIDACRRAISYASNRNENWHFALVQTEDHFHGLKGNNNPYWVTKSFFLKMQVAVQEIKIENMALDDNNEQLIYVLNGISLASYAKMGGIPWLLKANPVIAHELVIGLGSCHIGESRLGNKERIVGLTTVFTADGNYKLANKSSAVSFAQYPKALTDSLRETVGILREDQNWRPKDSVRLIFHAFKPFRDIEVEAVKAVMDDLGYYDCDFAFIHFVDDHTFHIFDENRKWGKGQLAPERGKLLSLGKREKLLTFKGFREMKRPGDGISQPVLMRLHRDSTFDDMNYLSKQAFQFACHSWRSFSPSPLPVTILYSELIARLLRGLEDVSGWDADVMLGKIGRTGWFL